MYNRVGYIYFVISLAAHLALLFGVAALPSSSDKTAVTWRSNPGEKIRVRLYEAPRESQLLTVKGEGPAVEEKKEVFLPEKKFLDFSDIPPGKEPEKALVYGRVSTEARNDFYRNKADKALQSKTVAALPSLRVRRLLVRKPSPSLDARWPRELSPPAKQSLREGQLSRPDRPPLMQEGRRGGEEPERRALQTRARPPSPRLEGREYRDVQHPQKQEVIREKNVYARLEPIPGEQGRARELSRSGPKPLPEAREKVREPRLLEKNIGGEDGRRSVERSRQRKPEVSASRELGLEIGGQPDVWEMIGMSVARLEQVPDIPSVELEEHPSIKNSDQDASNESEATVVSLDTRELKFVSYFWHIKQKISNVWSYPSEAVRMGMEGTAVIRMSLLRTGELEKVQLVRSSGFSMLDEEARDAVITAGPFHPFPEQIKDQKLIIEGYFRYLGGFWNVGGR